MLSENTGELMPSQHNERQSGSAFATPADMKILATLFSIVMGTVGLAQGPAERGPGPKPATATAASDILATQVALDRAGFSPGEIDGRSGVNLRRSVAAFQRANGLPESGQLDSQTTQRL